MKKDKENRTVRFTDPTPEGAAKRLQQAIVDSEIEGMAPSSVETRNFIAQLDRDGVSGEERFAKMTAYFLEKNRSANADQ